MCILIEEEIKLFLKNSQGLRKPQAQVESACFVIKKTSKSLVSLNELSTPNSENLGEKMIWIAKLIFHCVIFATFLPKSDLDYKPIIPLQITHQITKGIFLFLCFDPSLS